MARTEVLPLWRRLRGWPGGGALLGWLIGRVVPYAGSLPVRVVDLAPGRAEVALRDRRRVRNHLASIHAVALVNLGELTANLALMSAQPPGTRWIVTGMSAQYLKKARGVITARCEAPAVDWSQDGDWQGEVQLTDRTGAVVATLAIHWRLGPKAETGRAAPTSEAQKGL